MYHLREKQRKLFFLLFLIPNSLLCPEGSFINLLYIVFITSVNMLIIMLSQLVTVIFFQIVVMGKEAGFVKKELSTEFSTISADLLHNSRLETC